MLRYCSTSGWAAGIVIDWGRIEHFIGRGRREAPVVFVGVEEGLESPEELDADSRSTRPKETRRLNRRQGHGPPEPVENCGIGASCVLQCRAPGTPAMHDLPGRTAATRVWQNG